jgi:hypothetical protein
VVEGELLSELLYEPVVLVDAVSDWDVVIDDDIERVGDGDMDSVPEPVFDTEFETVVDVDLVSVPEPVFVSEFEIVVDVDCVSVPEPVTDTEAESVFVFVTVPVNEAVGVGVGGGVMVGVGETVPDAVLESVMGRERDVVTELAVTVGVSVGGGVMVAVCVCDPARLRDRVSALVLVRGVTCVCGGVATATANHITSKAAVRIFSLPTYHISADGNERRSGKR